MAETQTTITPHLVIKGAAEAIEFYRKAFGATEIRRMPGEDGKLMHAELQVGSTKLYLADEFPEWGSLGAATIGNTPVVLHLHVADADAVFNQAVEAGATVQMPLMDMFWGDRFGKIVDPFGHHWSIAHTIETLTTDQMQERMATTMAGAEPCEAVEC